MTAKIIDGKAYAAQIRQEVADKVQQLRTRNIIPALAVIIVGNDPASEVYVRSKGKQSKAAGMQSFQYTLEKNITQRELVALVKKLNADDAVHGILVQLPLPEHIDAEQVIDAIDPRKDVDGFHVHNVGRLSVGMSALVPCTPLGISLLLQRCHDSLSGKAALVIGRSNIVGKPVAQLLLQAGATVTIAHSKTTNLQQLSRSSDIVVAAVGRAQMVQGSWIQPGATVIDVGINRVTKTDGSANIVGDVDFNSVRKVAGWITPVPGGVGPMTIACLLRNTLTACRRIHNIQ